MIFALKKLRPYLFGSTLIFYFKHEFLRPVSAKKNIHGLLGRWVDIMAEYKLESRHKVEASNDKVDYLSRLDSELVDEQCRLLQEEMEKYLAKSEIVAAVDVTENGGQFDE